MGRESVGEPATRRRSGTDPVRILAFILGVILLLPGACSLGFMIATFGDSNLGSLPELWLVCILVSLGGVVLIVNALRGPQRRDPDA